jgi:dolichyl-phosphate beta-glucosyltransferase
LASLKRNNYDYEIIVIDDGSVDETVPLVQAFIEKRKEERNRVLLLKLKRHQGKGAAVKTGILQAQKEMVCFIDADLPYPLSKLEEMISLLSTGAEVVIGCRSLIPAGQGYLKYSKIRRILSVGYHYFCRRMLNLQIEDTQCGFKCFRTKIARLLFQKITTKNSAFDTELIYLIEKWKIKLRQVPLRVEKKHSFNLRLLGRIFQMGYAVWQIKRQEKKGVYNKEY